MSNEKRISFLFHPYDYENKGHVVEKDMDGKKRKYIKGVTSGVAVDGHGEKITDNCIKSFQLQANTGDVLLYAGKHGVDYTDDIGKLTSSSILPNLDWMTEFRLYDELDNIGQNTLERADKAWRQSAGLPPYTVAKQFGFSIEGFIPDDGIISMDANGKRVIDKITLDGVVLVPRPAYQTSIAQSIYKALDERSPWNVEKEMSRDFKNKIQADELENSYFRRRFQFQDLLENEIEKIMCNVHIGDKEETLHKLFDEYKSAMVELIMNSSKLFEEERPLLTDSEQGLPAEVAVLYRSDSYIKDHHGTRTNQKVQVIKGLITEVDKLILKLQ